jgi:two-component system, sensor histidine kinase YesM
MRFLNLLSELAANAKFRMKLIVSYSLLVSFIILILGFAYYQISARNMLSNVRESLGNVVLNNNQLLDEKMQDIRDKSEVLPIDDELYQAIMSVDAADNESILKADRRITQILFRYFGGDEDIYSSFIVTPAYTFGNAGRMFVTPDGFFSSAMHRQSIAGQGDLEWIPAYSYAEMFEEPLMAGLNYEYSKLVSAVKELNLTYIDEQGIFHVLPDRMTKPVLMVNLTPDYVSKLFREYAEQSGFSNLSYGIVDEDGTVVIASDEQMIAEKHLPSWLADTYGLKQGSLQREIDGEQMLISYDRMESTGWISYIEIPVEDALQDLKALRLYSIAFLAVMLTVSILLASLMSIFITKPIIRIKKAMKQMERGNFHVHIPEKGRDELGQLIRMFNHMNARIQTLIEENYATRLREKEAELASLNLQLNPHFLYNTLTTMYWIALENNQQEMSRIMLYLAEMLQTSTRSKSETWPLRTDLDWLNKYIYIMSSRFENVFAVDIDVDERLLDMEVPKLFLQPFVENAIIHGLAETEEGGSIVIKGWQDGDRVLFSVEDNGNGIGREQIGRIKSGEARSTGMPNVEKRIKLLYGSSYGVDIYSTEGKGTQILIRMARHPGAQGRIDIT